VVSDLHRALELAKKGDWDGAHQIVGDDSSKMAARIHAYLHRVEGDLSNARYWYGRAGVPPETGTLEEEWNKLSAELAKART
jgi:hypothetical protein